MFNTVIVPLLRPSCTDAALPRSYKHCSTYRGRCWGCVRHGFPDHSHEWHLQAGLPRITSYSPAVARAGPAVL